VAVFVLPPSYQALGERLRRRSHDAEAEIRCRLEIARQEVAGFAEYDYVVVNDELDACVDRLRSIIVAERARLRVMRPRAEQILRTFNQGSGIRDQ
jgi:guanylate kinase